MKMKKGESQYHKVKTFPVLYHPMLTKLELEAHMIRELASEIDLHPQVLIVAVQVGRSTQTYF